MGNRRRRLGFAFKPLAECRVLGQGRQQDLHDNLPFEHRVARQEHETHSTVTHQRQEMQLGGQGVPELVHEGGQILLVNQIRHWGNLCSRTGRDQRRCGEAEFTTLAS